MGLRAGSSASTIRLDQFPMYAETRDSPGVESLGVADLRRRSGESRSVGALDCSPSRRPSFPGERQVTGTTRTTRFGALSVHCEDTLRRTCSDA